MILDIQEIYEMINNPNQQKGENKVVYIYKIMILYIQEIYKMINNPNQQKSENNIV